MNIKQIGHAMLHLDKWGEDFLIPLPNVKVKGLLSGTPYPELHGTYYLASSSGFVSEVDFSGKGFFSGAKNSFEARMYRHDERSEILYTVSGQWNDKFTIHDVARDIDIETYDSASQTAAPLQVDDVERQDQWESRRAWQGVIESLNKGDMGGASRAKSKIEQGQRNMRKDEEKKGEKWKPAFYKNESGDPVFERLAAMVGAKLEADRTMGVWKLDREAVETLKKPYRGDLVPTNTATGETPTSTPRGSIDQTRLVNGVGGSPSISRGNINQARRSVDQTPQSNGVENGAEGGARVLPINLEEQQQKVDQMKQQEANEAYERKKVEDFLRYKYRSSAK